MPDQSKIKATLESLDLDSLTKTQLWGTDAPLDDDQFESDPELIFEQAREIGRYEMRDGAFFLIFERPREIIDGERNVIDGSQIVAYDCDENGRVLDWQRRSVVEAKDFQSALIKFRFLRANGLLHTDNFEF